MDSWKFWLLNFQLVHFWFVSLVAFVKSFFEYLGIITCDDNYVCYIALTALKTHDSCLWYLDSGCSRHMTGNRALFKTLFEGKIGTVTFGDRSKSVIKGIGTVDMGCRFLKMSSMLMGWRLTYSASVRFVTMDWMFSSPSMNVRYLMKEVTTCVLVLGQLTIVMV